MSESAFLTPKMYEWIEHAGISEQAAMLLAAERGGTRVTIPVKVSSYHWLTLLIGRDNADKLCAYYSGEEVEIPMGPMSSGAQRHRKIRDLDRAGYTYEKIARLVGCDRRTVIRHVKGTSNRPKDPDQCEMFDDFHPRPRGDKKLKSA